MSFRCCAVVPSRNHHRAIHHVVAGLRQAGLPVFVVDDGSEAETRAVLAGLDAPDAGVSVIRLEVNRGKGAAVIAGFRRAADLGFTHAVQVDADGQHDLAALAPMLALARDNPEAVIVGTPVYDSTVPPARAIGRWLTTVWVWIETLSLSIRDAMCGFRLYPIAPFLDVVGRERVARRMDFDIDIIVRLAWRGVTMINVPVRVTYPEGNTSNFDMLRDNWRITKLHTRLVMEMLWRFPSIVARRASSTHWAAMSERGALWGLNLVAGLYRVLGQRFCLAALAPVALYFQLTGTEQRRASQGFLARAFRAGGERRSPNWRDVFRHTLDFARKAVETIAAWAGDIDRARLDVAQEEVLRRASSEERGALLIVSHLGNVELSRALLDERRRARLTLLVHTRHAENYNRVLRAFRAEAGVNTFQVSEITPATAALLEDRIAAGEWIAIAGDRTPVSGDARVSRVEFLGAEAAFPQGPYILAHLLRCPVYLMFCLRENGGWRVYFEKFAERVELPRRAREDALRDLAQRYAARLESYCVRAPYQWYNFFDFWAPHPRGSAT